MKYLIVNKFLYPNGGSETYIFGLGEYLKSQGHEVQYFGMEHENNIVGNAVGTYTSNMDFHGGSKLSKLTMPFKTIKSQEAASKIRKVLEDLDPDVVHLNNFNFQITPSIIPEIRDYEKKCGHKIKIIYTAHDYQLICPNHMLRDIRTGVICEKCLRDPEQGITKARFSECRKNKCIHGSTARSILGTAEAKYWNEKNKVYNEIDLIVCPSEFMKTKMDTNPEFASKTKTLHNFMTAANKPSGRVPEEVTDFEGNATEYVLYFGRFSKEKGIGTLVNVCRSLPGIPFVFAGSGPLANELKDLKNVKEVGFKTGQELTDLIAGARFSIYPSEWYENCPFSVMESQVYKTPVIGADIGGIPELIKAGETGELFASGDQYALAEEVRKLWYDRALCDKYTENCGNVHFDSVEEYTDKLLKLIGEA